ncbi:MAG TPA: M23 family metallopeptidase [Thermoanaerobaculia bacterium]|nr:M23 family metallopeptidase [Thermoanaerobaculia bacterium]
MIEIQFHSGNLRRGVRHLLLGPRPFVAILVAGTLLLFFLLTSMAAAPTVIRRAYRTNYLREMRQERAIQASRLREHASQLAGLEKLLDGQRVDVEKLIAVYGLEGSAPGHGSAPETRRTASGDELADARRQEAFLRTALMRLDRQLDLLARFEKDNEEMIRETPAILPIPADQFVVTHAFGWRTSPFTRGPDFHAGLDLAAPTGTPIVAAADGIVTFAGRYPVRGSIFWWRFGNLVAIRHAGRFVTIYAHCDTLRVKAGQRVRQGDVIATVGNSGWSSNSHLHYEVRTSQAAGFRPVDPQIYILNYRWNNEDQVLNRTREGRRKETFETMPAAFAGGGGKGRG